jgi:hypothetical protein
MLVDEDHDAAVICLVPKALREHGHRASAGNHEPKDEREDPKLR